MFGGRVLSTSLLVAACSGEPVVTRPADPQAALPALPPIGGGTLLVSRDARRVVAADPDTDRVAIADVGSDLPVLVAEAALARGEEPGRLAEDGERRVHVVLRRGGALATLDLASGELLARRPVCVAPRGIAYDEPANLLHVACASGELVSLTPASGEPKRRIRLEPDLRDVAVVPGGLVVTRFKSAELFRVDAAGAVVRITPSAIERAAQDPSRPESDPLEAAVAWRSPATAAGQVFVLHQYALARPIELGTSAAAPAPYRALGACGGIVAQGVSALGPGGTTLEMGLPLPVSALSVDVAVSTDGGWAAVAHPGSREQPVTIYRTENLSTRGRTPVRCAEPDGRVLVVEGQPVALSMFPGRVPAAVTASDWLVVQTRNPRRLAFYSGFAGPRVTLALGAHANDPGHELFHRDAGSGIACAQCHVEGGEDGRVWRFEPAGARRTQALNVGLDGTAPFHWDGDLASVRDLVDDVFVHRMGLAAPSAAEHTAIERWLFALRPPLPLVDPAADTARRGRALFESAEVGCSECHTGPGAARDASFDVGVEPPHAFQVPPLRGVGYRAPFLHNGCARTLRERFDPACGGGDLHGRTSQLDAAQIDDLVAYLESL